MSTQYGRLAEARDKARPIAPDETAEVYAADLDAILTHYAKIMDEAAFLKVDMIKALKAARFEIETCRCDGSDFALAEIEKTLEKLTVRAAT